MVLETLLAPKSCAYVISLLLSGVIICLCSGGVALLSIEIKSLSYVGSNAFVSCLPAALNFGVSSMLLKALL